MSKSSIIVQVNKMVAAGVDIVDIGGESTRPGAKIVSIEEELQRVSSAIEWVKEVSDIPISVDTYKTEVMRGVLDLNIDMINDVNALQAEGAIKVVSSSSVLVCLMHKQGDFRTMQHNPLYNNVVETVAQFLEQRVLACKKAGIKNENILIDPGFGFGKALLHNVELFKSLDKILQIGSPVLIGVSRKSMIGALQGGDLDWVSENAISEKFKSKIISTPVGNISEPIILPEGILFFKVRDKRKLKKFVNLEDAKNQLVNAEKTKILRMHSLSHYENLRKSITINYY